MVLATNDSKLEVTISAIRPGLKVAVKFRRPREAAHQGGIGHFPHSIQTPRIQAYQSILFDGNCFLFPVLFQMLARSFVHHEHIYAIAWNSITAKRHD
jgi:hypothetical protein